ncbi:lipid-A-disaccharide kinase [Mesocricetibacter intestinalis]|uniref:Tetraacyldisaccharide 4'-kinase n=1 Tax=Mesocricetibacter intestinalis TaxID=1521930 RepID=A0A4R6VBR7_9PAST|nr:tetraacyldisaccharide 4'-kinase [Mesocricetibacter intestinalis]TDQ59105.1 lipid-A-disaccharide kinase [Mesocricetibacter intestinalis]
MHFWYQNSKIAYLLLPFSCLFRAISAVRRLCFKAGIFASYRAPVPVIVVGNLSVGGNGKTPVVIWLAQQLSRKGLSVAVISRGYGSKAEHYPLWVTADTDPRRGGDEPVLIATRTGVPVVISANRQEAIELLLERGKPDLIISDDGLQHYRLQRDIEIVVMDAERGLGNGLLLPAGPLRELPQRLAEVDLVIGNGGTNAYTDCLMRLAAHYAVNLCRREKRLLSEFDEVVAIAGIGNPQRFFNMLKGLNIRLRDSHSFQDHQQFSPELLKKVEQNLPLFMTEKDAVKCRAFARENWWYVPVEAEIDGERTRALLEKISALCTKSEPKA